MPKLLLFNRAKAQPAAFHLPEGTRVYAVGDVHGRADCLGAIEELVRRDAWLTAAPDIAAEVIFLGDYIDRGADSRTVLERLSAGRFAGLPTRFLMGNHEDALLHFLADPASGQDWLAFGGATTLASYGVRAPQGGGSRNLHAAAVQLNERLPPHHLEFLQNLELSIALGDYLFVHAGIRPGKAVERQLRRDLLTIRDPFLGHRGTLPARVVHGHSVSAEPEILPHRIGVDTGAYANGRLSCAVIEADRVRIIATG